MAHLLAQAISGYNGSMGTTKDGEAWMRKALDPSDTTAQCIGIPDETTSDVGIERYQQTIFLRPPQNAAATDLFDYEITLTGHPIAPVNVIIRNQSNQANTDASFTYINNQISGGAIPDYFSGNWIDRKTATTAAFIAKQNTFSEMYQKARHLYSSLTINQIAAALSDQGQIIAVQQDTNPTISYETVNGTIYRTTAYQSNDFPTINNAANMNRVYQEPSNGGIYMPLHLSLDYKQFKNTMDRPLIRSDVATPSTSNMPHMFSAIEPATPIIPMMNATMGTIHILGVAPGTTFQCKYIGGYEGLPYAGSSTTTHLNRSPAFDPVALEAFSSITRDILRDAYPADWNFLGTLGRWIKEKWNDTIKPAATKLISVAPQIAYDTAMGALTGGQAGAGRAALTGVMGAVGFPGPEGWGLRETSKRRRGGLDDRVSVVFE